MPKADISKRIEAVLFAAGEPVRVNKLASLLKCSTSSLTSALANLEKRLLETSGLRLLQKNGAVQILANKDYAPLIEKLFQREHREELTRAGLEVLAIAAYEGPISRRDIEEIRGVNSVVTIRNLMLRGLVEKGENGYQLSFAALRCFGLTSPEELPKWREIKEEINSVRHAQHALNRPYA